MHSNLCSNDKKRQKLVYINDDLFNGTFKRTHTGDYHCTKEQVKEMLRDGMLEEKGVTKGKRCRKK